MGNPWSGTKGALKIGLLSISIILTSCNTLKRVEENELLLTKNTIYTDGSRVSDSDIESLIAQQPNSTILGYPFLLNLYNLAKVNPDSTYQVWLNKKEKRVERLENLLSRKQVNRLGESFLVKGYSEWLKNIGEAPEVIDTVRAEKSIKRLSAYYGTKGWFNNRTDYEIVPGRKKQRAAINYQVELGKPYFIDSLSEKISSQSVDSLYNLNKNNTFIKAGEQFDLANFNNERSRLTNLFRNSGIYNFQESSISYNIVRDTTPSNDDQAMHVELNIEDLRRRGDTAISTSEYKVFKFDKINIYPDFSYDTDPDSLTLVEYNDYNIYYNGKPRYKPKALADAIFFKKDSLYRDIDRVRTYRRINNLNTFKYPNIQFVEDSTETRLTSNIFMAPRPRYSLGVDFDVTHSNIQTLGIVLGTSLLSRNIFRGAETLSLSARGSFGLLSDDTSTEDFFTEIGGDINITFPRILFPFINKANVIPYYMLPQTRLSIGTSFQKNIGLDRQSVNSFMRYNWTPDDFKRHAIELFNLQYVRNLNPDRFFNVFGSTYNSLNDVALNYQGDPVVQDFFQPTGDPFDPLELIIPEGTTGFTEVVLNGDLTTTEEDFTEVARIEERRIRLTENNFILATNYSFSKTNRQGITDNSFYQFRSKVESAGALLSALSGVFRLEENDNGDKLVFGVPYSQYIKTEFDFVKYWDLRRTKVLAFRSFVGLAVPYGNSNSVPFVRSYFGGGSNDNRAWFPYSLGPGSTSNLNDFNEANFKIAFNLEYRFPLAGKLKGAMFADSGNIWNLWDNVVDPAATFTGIESLADIALGVGFGLRYDFTYFVFRVDTGFKTYNPALEPSRRWFTDFNFSEAVVQIGINYPF